MEKQDSEQRLMLIIFAAGAVLGTLYGLLILGPAIGNPLEGTAIGTSIGIGAGTSIGAVLEVGKKPDTVKKIQNKLLFIVVAVTALLVFSTALMVFSETH